MSRFTRYDEKQKQYIRLASRLAVDNKLGKLEDLEEELGLTVEEMAIILKAIKPNLDFTSVFDEDDDEHLHIWQKDGYAEEPLVNTNTVDVNNTFKKWLEKDKSE